MEKLDSEKWAEEVLGSMQGSKMVAPSRDLFEDIQNRIDQGEVRRLPFAQKIMGMAAAILVLALNIFAMNAYGFFENDRTSIVSVEAGEASQLISDFKIYE